VGTSYIPSILKFAPLKKKQKIFLPAPLVGKKEFDIPERIMTDFGCA